MNKAKAKKKRIFIRILKSPITILQKVTDFYMSGVSSCASRFEENMVVNCSVAPQVSHHHLPRSFSVSSSKGSRDEEDGLKDLIRAASTKLSQAKIEMENADQSQKPRTTAGLRNAIDQRSYSAGIGRIGRIDEEETCAFDEGDARVNTFPRTKSYALPHQMAVRQ